MPWYETKPHPPLCGWWGMENFDIFMKAVLVGPQCLKSVIWCAGESDE